VKGSLSYFFSSLSSFSYPPSLSPSLTLLYCASSVHVCFLFCVLQLSLTFRRTVFITAVPSLTPYLHCSINSY
jgi:hypothetical protein